MTEQIRFNDGAGYERFMGVWSRLAGEVFLDWLAPATKQRWIDIGCGNGAFTDLIVSRCSPAEIHGVDPSPEQLAFARARAMAVAAQFHQGDAMALPFQAASFDVDIASTTIRVAESSLLPSVTLQGSAGHSSQSDPTLGTYRNDQASITGQVIAPIYDGGIAASQTRQTKELASQSRLVLDQVRDQTRTAATHARRSAAASKSAADSAASKVG